MINQIQVESFQWQQLHTGGINICRLCFNKRLEG